MSEEEITVDKEDITMAEEEITVDKKDITMAEEEINNNINIYRQNAVKFIESNKSHLINIYQTHTNGTGDNEGPGVLFINLLNFEKTQKIDVSFITLKLLSDEVLKKIDERKEKNSQDIIYFILITPYEEKIIEIDIKTLIK